MWTSPPSRILVPVDFSEASARAVAVASALAARVGGHLHLLHAEVLDVPAYFTHDQLKTLERERTIARSRATDFLKDFAGRCGASSFTSQIEEGLPSAMIVEAARQADLVVMGTHGRRGPARWWLGSVAERVIHSSPTPVLVVRAESEGTPAEAIFTRPMLLSAAPADEEAVRRVAAGLAAAFGGQVADAATACETDLARQREATIIVLSRAARHGTLLAHPAEHWLTSCSLPMLFVPEAVSKSVGTESMSQAT